MPDRPLSRRIAALGYPRRRYIARRAWMPYEAVLVIEGGPAFTVYEDEARREVVVVHG